MNVVELINNIKNLNILEVRNFNNEYLIKFGYNIDGDNKLINLTLSQSIVADFKLTTIVDNLIKKIKTNPLKNALHTNILNKIKTYSTKNVDTLFSTLISDTNIDLIKDILLKLIDTDYFSKLFIKILLQLIDNINSYCFNLISTEVKKKIIVGLLPDIKKKIIFYISNNENLQTFKKILLVVGKTNFIKFCKTLDLSTYKEFILTFLEIIKKITNDICIKDFM